MNYKFKEGDLVEFVEFRLHLRLRLRPRLRLRRGRLRLRPHPRLKNTLGIILKQLPPEEVWYDWGDFSEEEKKEAEKPENNCYVWFSQQDLKESAVFQDELKEVK